MKDYYNILGVKKNATYYDITEAYRELSAKYHPDNHHNENEAGEDKYNDIQEAYNTLSNGIKRREYDNFIIHTEKSLKEKNNNAIPFIDFFRTDKSEFEYGDEVEFSWKTQDADKITLVPFGPVQPFGNYKHKIKNFKNKLLTFELIAENTLNGRETKASVSLKNKNFDEFYTHFKKEIENQYQPTPPITKDIEKDHLPYVPGKKEIVRNREPVSKEPIRKTIPLEQQPVANDKIRPDVKRSEKSENNVLLFIVIAFLIVGISILIYLGFFM
ncbi:MAG: DnaJ domain-containing protein [Bacteroidota bacterium]|nr:DnaJ domain-containing protein [Bacteroidota bacterium]